MSKNRSQDTIDLTQFTNFDQKKTNSLISKRIPRYITGYDIKSCIYDLLGNFYIIHPEEKNIERDILTGDILYINKVVGNIRLESKNHYIISHRIYLYAQSCLSKNLLINHSNTYIPLAIFETNDIINFKFYDFNYEKNIMGRIMTKFIETLNFNDDPNINRSILLTLIYAYINKVDNIVLIMIILLEHSEYKLSGLNINYKSYKDLYSSDDINIYYNLAKNIFHKINLIEQHNQQTLAIKFTNEKKQYLEQKQKILLNIKNKLNYWNLDITLDHYKKFNILDNQDTLDVIKNIHDYNKENAKYLTNNTINLFIDILVEESIVINFNSAQKLLKYYLDNKNAIDKLKNINETKNDANYFSWFDINLPVKKFIDNFISSKNSFIYGFSILNTVMFNPIDNDFVDINFPTKRFKSIKSTLTPKSDISIYLFRDTLKNEISILINTDMDTLVEYNLYGYNPLKNRQISLYSDVKTSDINKKLLNKFLNIISNKNKYINYLKKDTIKIPSLDKLFSYPNNFTEYLLNLWTTDVNPNIYHMQNNTQKDNKYFPHVGGAHAKCGNLPNKLIKINFNKLLHILTNNNIDYSDFFKLLLLFRYNNHLIYHKHNYLYIL